MREVSTIGLDIAKHVFQVRGIEASGEAVIRRRLRRADVVAFLEALPPCLVGMEANATGHYWAREIRALGHDVRLMPPSYVKPYVKRQKNDAADAVSQRLETIPGIGPITASAIVATITDPNVFTSRGQLAAWIGLVPRQTSSGGKVRLGRIIKKGSPYIRRLLVINAHAVLRFSRKGKVAPTQWAAGLFARRTYTVATVALTNKMARILWASLTRGEDFKPQLA